MPALRCCDTWVRTGRPAAPSSGRALPELAGTYDPAPGKRWGGAVPLAPRVLTVLSARGEIVRGPNDGSLDHVAAALEPPRRTGSASSSSAPSEPHDAQGRPDRAGGCGRSGPATAADIKWWFGTTLTAVRAALTDIGAVEVDLARQPWLCAAGRPRAGTRRAAVVRAAARAWTPPRWAGLTRDWYLGEHRAQVFDTQRQRRPHRVVERTRGGRLVSGRRRPRAAAAHRGPGPRRAARPAATRRRAHRRGWTACGSARAFRRRCPKPAPPRRAETILRPERGAPQPRNAGVHGWSGYRRCNHSASRVRLAVVKCGAALRKSS